MAMGGSMTEITRPVVPKMPFTSRSAATGGQPADKRTRDKKASIREKVEESRAEGTLAPRMVSQNRKNRKRSMIGKAVHFPVRRRSSRESRFPASEGGG